MYVCMYACMHACMYVYMYVCMYVCVYTYIYIYIYNITHIGRPVVHPGGSPELPLQLLLEEPVDVLAVTRITSII